MRRGWTPDVRNSSEKFSVNSVIVNVADSLIQRQWDFFNDLLSLGLLMGVD
jgi:hypothetical protein